MDRGRAPNGIGHLMILNVIFYFLIVYKTIQKVFQVVYYLVGHSNDLKIDRNLGIIYLISGTEAYIGELICDDFYYRTTH